MTKKTMLIFLIVIDCFFMFSCNIISADITLPGKIVTNKLWKDEYFIYADADKASSSFKLRQDKEVSYGGVYWLNTKDAFIGTEALDRLNSDKSRSNIVLLDLSGKLIDRIYEAGYGEIAWPQYSSRDDRYLLFTTYGPVDDVKYPFEGLTPMLSLKIMDLTERKVIKSIDSIGRSPGFSMKESPWLYDRYQFVYSISSQPKLYLVGEEKPIYQEETTEGIYIFDVLTGEHKLLIPGGHSAIASPVSNEIAYEKDNSIRVLDLSTNEEKIIYKHGSREQLRGKHWTPDGKSIYFAYTYNWGIRNLDHTGEKLIEVSTGKKKPFKKIGHGFDTYTWK